MSKKNNSMFKVILFFLMHFATTNLLATGQLPDLLVVKNDTSYIYSNPLFLEVYFNKFGNQNSINFEGCPSSSSCLRGYQAIWTIEKDSFFLIKVISCMCPERQEVDLKLIFGDNYNNQKVFADWFSGLLINPYGRRIRYYHIGFSSIYEFENNCQIVSGIVIKSKKNINYKECIRKRNRLDYLCAKYLIYEHVNKYLKWNKIKKESAVLMNLEITINKHGKIKFKKPLNDTEKTIKNSLKNFGIFNIIKDKGQKISEQFGLILEFDFVNKKVIDLQFEREFERRKPNCNSE